MAILTDGICRKPVNKTAALVVSVGEYYEPDKRVQVPAEGDLPIMTKPLPPNTENLSGTRFGRFTVIGMAEEYPGRWVVRCICGRYSLRVRKAIKNPGNKYDMCEHCRHLCYIKKREHFQRTGKDLELSEIYR